MQKPEGVTQSTDGYYYGSDGRYCEDCWRVIPKYVDFNLGLVSPESDDPKGNAGKWREIEMGASEYSRKVRQPLRKAVCLDCYLLAFARVYPNAKLPELSRSVRVTTQFEDPEPISETVYVPDPMKDPAYS